MEGSPGPAMAPGWLALTALVLAASFPGGIPTLPPFLGALLASTLASLVMAGLRPAERVRSA